MISVIATILKYMPLIFGVGFLAPLIAQVIVRAGWTLPFGAAPLAVGLVIGGLWGAQAQFRGRWI